MSKKYTKMFRKGVEQEIRVNSSNVDIANKFGMPYGTVAQWRWHVRNPQVGKARSGKPLTEKTQSNNEGLSIDWNKAYMETIIDMGLHTVAIVKEAKRQRLIAYLIGVVIGMAIGSLVMRAIS